MTEAEALNKVAEGQGALWELTKSLAEEDKHDSLFLAQLTIKHSDIYDHIKDELRMRFGLSEKEIAAADKLAGNAEDK